MWRFFTYSSAWERWSTTFSSCFARRVSIRYHLRRMIEGTLLQQQERISKHILWKKIHWLIFFLCVTILVSQNSTDLCTTPSLSECRALVPARVLVELQRQQQQLTWLITPQDLKVIIITVTVRAVEGLVIRSTTRTIMEIIRRQNPTSFFRLIQQQSLNFCTLKVHSKWLKCDKKFCFKKIGYFLM